MLTTTRSDRHTTRWTGLGAILAMVLGVLGPAAIARAGFQEKLLIGFNLLDYQVGFQKNYLGDGWDFSAATSYAGQTYNFGLSELTLGATAPSTVRVNAGYTMRGIPAADFSMISNAPLSYTFTTNDGFQDLFANGEILFDIDTKINLLGFYDQTFQISSRGSYVSDGYFGSDEGSLDFDAGRIEVSGNIFLDLLAQVTAPFFEGRGVDNPFAKLSQTATRVNGLDELGALGDDQVASMLRDTLVSTVAGLEPPENAFNAMANAAPIPARPLDLTSLLETDDVAQHAPELAPVPEPTVLLLTTAGLPWLLLIRRRR